MLNVLRSRFEARTTLDVGLVFNSRFGSKTHVMCHPRRSMFSIPRFDTRTPDLYHPRHVGLVFNSSFGSKTHDMSS